MLSLTSLVVVLLLVVALFATPTEAVFGAGSAVALVLGLLMFFIILFAILGHCSRR